MIFWTRWPPTGGGNMWGWSVTDRFLEKEERRSLRIKRWCFPTFINHYITHSFLFMLQNVIHFCFSYKKCISHDFATLSIILGVLIYCSLEKTSLSRPLTPTFISPKWLLMKSCIFTYKSRPCPRHTVFGSCSPHMVLLTTPWTISKEVRNTLLFTRSLKSQ